MRITNTTPSLHNNPSFGMAQLTKKGEAIAKHIVHDKFINFVNQAPYSKANLLAESLQPDFDPHFINRICNSGTTRFADKNAQFVDKQLLTLKSRFKIKSFLRAEHSKAISTAQSGELTKLTENGQALVDSILRVFDSNISNPNISRKKCLKLLDIIKGYIPTEEHLKRVALLVDKFYVKK